MQTQKTGVHGFENFYQQIANYVQNLWINLNISSRDIITYVSCFGAGFLVGVLFRRYGKWIVSLMTTIVLVLLVLEHFNWISIHFYSIKIALGLHNGQEFADLYAKTKQFSVEICVACVAMLIGFKLG